MHQDPSLSSAHPLAREWIAAVQQSAVAAALSELFAEASTAIAARGPACWASGRCCNFAKTGHRLYVTGLEAAWTVHHARLQSRQTQLAQSREANAKALALPVLSPMSITAARERGDCPFLMDNSCTVHTIKPLACRVYFCDASAQQWQHELSEQLLTELRRVHEKHAISYRYAEWRELLEMFCVSGDEPAR